MSQRLFVFKEILKAAVHVHYFGKIVRSRYVSFNYRDVIYECRCGKRKLVKDVRHDDVYPFETNILITNQEMLKALHEND